MMLDDGFLSVVIPVYNEENNILNVLACLDQQTLSGYEVVIVDDGSTDNTVELIESFQSQTFNIKLLKQNNTGAARARENAIYASKGDYIAFIDCDDSIDGSTLEQAITPIVKDKSVNISLFKLISLANIKDSNQKEFDYYTDLSCVTGEDAFSQCISSWGLHGFGIYKKSILIDSYNTYYQYNAKKINYLNNDEVITRICFSNAEKIYLSEGQYYFITNPASTTRRMNKNYYKVIYNAFYLEQYILGNNFNEIALKEAAKLIISTIWGVALRYFKWRKYFSCEEKKDWYRTIREGTKIVKKNHKERNFKINKKSFIQLYTLYYLFIKP